MKKSIIVTLFLMFSVSILAGCSSEEAMSDVDLAEKYGMSEDEFNEMKQVGARMNMGVSDHMNMIEDEE